MRVQDGGGSLKKELSASPYKRVGCQKIVMSSSPSTRFDGKDINGKRESELSFPKVFLQVRGVPLFPPVSLFPHTVEGEKHKRVNLLS